MTDGAEAVSKMLEEHGFDPDTPKVLGGSGWGSWSSDYIVEELKPHQRASHLVHNIIREFKDPSRRRFRRALYYAFFFDDANLVGHYPGVRKEDCMKIGILLATMLVAVGSRGETTSGTVERTGKTLTVRGADGKSATFYVRLTDGKPDAEQEVSVGKALRRGLPVTVDWTKGDDGKRYIDSLASNGTVTGRVAEADEKWILHVDTPKLGRLRFGARWIQVGQEWQPDPKEVALIQSAKTGAKVRVTYVLEEYLRINELKILE